MKEKILKESDKCRYVERQQAFRSCNTHECEKETATQTTERVTTTTKKHVEPRVQFIQNDAITCKLQSIFMSKCFSCGFSFFFKRFLSVNCSL